MPLTPPQQPAYLQILQRLTEEIGGGEPAPGERLPPERELAARFGVSRMTLRQALAALERTGAVERRVGRGGGTFVAEAKAELTGLRALSEELRGLGVRSGVRVLEAQARPAGSGEVPVLGDGPVLALRRIRIANGQVLALERIVLPLGPFPGLSGEPLAGTIAELLKKKYGTAIARREERLEPTVARVDEAAPLEVAPGTPLFLVRRVSYAATGRAVELARDLYRGDRLRLRWSSPGEPA